MCFLRSGTKEVLKCPNCGNNQVKQVNENNNFSCEKCKWESGYERYLNDIASCKSSILTAAQEDMGTVLVS